jgi:transcriptional regulator GlxA family with amidase domain
MDARVTWAIEMMEAGLGQRIRMADIARQVGLSSSRFTRLFRQETGMTPCRYCQTLRLRRAEALLAHTPLTIRQVMVLVGISHPGRFARDFRRYHGFNPRSVQRREPDHPRHRS